MACGIAKILGTGQSRVSNPEPSALRSALRLLALSYFAFLNWQLFTPVTLVSAGNWDKAYHAVAFLVLAGLAATLWRGVRLKRWVLLLLAYAAFTEILQYFIPGRAFSVGDWLADALGVVLGVAISMALPRRLLPAALRVH